MKTVETSKSNNKIKITPTIIHSIKESVELIEEEHLQEQLIQNSLTTSTVIELNNTDNEMNLNNVENNNSNILTLDNYIGQQKVVDLLRISISAAIKRGEVLGHIFLVGERGSGKTTLIETIANEMNTQVKIVSFSTIKKESELATILSCLCQGEILVIENFNKIPFDCISLLSSAMDNYYFDIKIGKGPSARNIRFDLPPFTVIAVMEENQSIPQELMDCFSIVASMERYSPLELCNLAMKFADSIKVEITKNAALCLVKYADGSYRNMTKIIKRAADFALIRNNNIIDTNIANTVIETLGLFKITSIKDDLYDSDDVVIANKRINYKVDSACDNNVFYLETKDGIEATMIYDNHLFKVLAGSKYNINISPSLSSSEVTNRKKYEMNGVMNNGVLLKDIIFTSASSAAKQIVGYSVNGKNVWKRKDGLTIGKYMEQF